jgi:hypothetical protein
MGYSLFWDVRQSRSVVNDVSVQLIGHIFKGLAVQEEGCFLTKFGCAVIFSNAATE